MAELLAVPLKKSSDVDIVKPLKNLIQATYSSSEQSEDFTDAINELAKLRTSAIWKAFEKESLEVIYSYYDQLAALETKIPAHEVQIPFKWKDAFDKGSIFGGRMSLTVNSLAYEKMCILFNIAALQSAVAASHQLDTEESLKQAAKLLQQSAGIFSYLKSNIMMAVHQETTADLSPDTLNALALLMLAQAQEVIVYKCIRDEMKESMVAKVAAQCEEMYVDALRALSKDTLKPMWDRHWLSTVSAKIAAYNGLAQFYQSLVCRANKAVGEEISRLQVAVEQLKKAQGLVSQANLYAAWVARAQRHLADATKDNDFIYHERVPDSKQLEPIGRAAVAKPLPLPDRFGPPTKDLFGALVPAAVHQATVAAEARRSDTVTTHVNKLREGTQLLNSILASLNLPACIERTQGAALPQSIREKAAAVRVAGGLDSLRHLMTELPDLLTRNREILDEADRMLREEAEADAALRQQFGARWQRTDSAKLTETFRANSAKYRQILDNATRADSIVQQKFEQHKEGIEMLCRSDSEIVAGVPSAPQAPADSSAVARLARLMEQVETMKAERDVIESELKSSTLDMRAQFLEALARDGAIDEPALTQAALGHALGALTRQARDSIAQQERLVAEIQAAHEQFARERGGGGTAGDTRDAALGKLQAASDAFHELKNNLNEGIKFYNDLTQLLVAFQNKVSDFCFARRTEKEELLKDLTQEASRPARAAPTPPQPAHHHQIDEPDMTRKVAPPRPPPPTPASAPTAPASAPGAAAAAAPGAQLPYPAQPTGMPLPYAAPGQAPYPYYPAPPMPATYNPYATLPYPHHMQAYQNFPPGPQYQGYQYPQGTQFPPPQGYNPYQQQ